MAKYLKPTNVNRSNHPLYRTWVNMMQVCYNRNNPSYYRNRARGIVVCERWLDFDNFVEDIGEKPKSGYFHRTDTNKSFSPDNCYWDVWKVGKVKLACNKGLRGLFNKLIKLIYPNIDNAIAYIVHVNIQAKTA